MKDAVLLIGGHGVLGRPVARRLVRDGFAVRALARSPEKAKALLPPAVTVLPGDLENPASIEAALEGCGAVYLSVDTRPGERFRAETDGLRNIVRAARRRNAAPRLLVLSAFGVSNPGAARHSWWHVREKHEAQAIAKTSGLPWTIFEPTWFMESLPLFVSGKNFVRFAGARLDVHWVAGDDFGRTIAAALAGGRGEGEIVPVQGPERLTFASAARRFIAAYDPRIRLWPVPLAALRAAGLFNADARDLARVFTASGAEPAPDPSVWKCFAAPVMTVEDYAAYVRATGDSPRKR